MLFDFTAAQALEDLLDRERELILAGKIAELSRIQRHKERLLSRLATQKNGRLLTRIRQRAERNQTLLTASARGLKAARKRIESFTVTSTPMRTYSADGAAQDLRANTPKSGMNHRA